nr:hypothetical protein [Streptomyces sp. S1D4-11]QIY96769.1 hypothetical protein HEP87_25610 [Streptomyces sp. S1D4-11]
MAELTLGCEWSYGEFRSGGPAVLDGGPQWPRDPCRASQAGAESAVGVAQVLDEWVQTLSRFVWVGCLEEL